MFDLVGSVSAGRRSFGSAKDGPRFTVRAVGFGDMLSQAGQPGKLQYMTPDRVPLPPEKPSLPLLRVTDSL